MCKPHDHLLHGASPQVKTSQLAMGACERVKKLAHVYPQIVLSSPILPELVQILKDGPGMPLGNAALSTMSTLTLVPEGRQALVMAGVATPVIRCVPTPQPLCYLPRQTTWEPACFRHMHCYEPTKPWLLTPCCAVQVDWPLRLRTAQYGARCAAADEPGCR